MAGAQEARCFSSKTTFSLGYYMFYVYRRDKDIMDWIGGQTLTWVMSLKKWVSDSWC